MHMTLKASNQNAEKKHSSIGCRAAGHLSTLPFVLNGNTEENLVIDSKRFKFGRIPKE